MSPRVAPRGLLAVLATVAAVLGVLAPSTAAMVPPLRAASGSGGGTASGSGSGIARACSQPRFTTSRPDAMWADGRYIVHNNMWNAAGYHVTQRLRACSHGNWSAVATADNRTGDGAVKTYPNVHRDYHDWSTGHEPRLSAFRSIRSTFAARTPGSGIYDAAYDIWLDGVPGTHEVMIWTDNHRQVPAGAVVERRLRFAHRSWRLYAGRGGSILSFVPARPLRQGTIDLAARLSWLVRHGYLPRRSTLGQVCFGFEIVSTQGFPARFKVDRFSISSRRR